MVVAVNGSEWPQWVENGLRHRNRGLLRKNFL
jgi:hypothetical protein